MSQLFQTKFTNQEFLVPIVSVQILPDKLMYILFVIVHISSDIFTEMFLLSCELPPAIYPWISDLYSHFFDEL